MSYEDAKIKYNEKISLLRFASDVFLAVIYDKKHYVPLTIDFVNRTNQPLSVAVDPGFFCEDLHSEGDGINKTFEVPPESSYRIDEIKDGGELDFTNYWYFYITDADKNLYCLSTTFSGRTIITSEIPEETKLVLETDEGKKIENKEAIRLIWRFTEKIKSKGELLVPPFYDCDFKPQEKFYMDGFLEDPNKDFDYLKKYGFATEVEVKEALKKIPEAIEKRKIEMGYKMARLKKLEAIQEKLAEKMDKLKPKIGDIIYLETENEMGDLILGGKAKISDIEYHPSKQVFIKVEGFPELTYGWQFLEPKQEELKKKFGEQWFRREA